MGSINIIKPKHITLSSPVDNSLVGMPKVKPGVVGSEVRTLPLCHDAPYC